MLKHQITSYFLLSIFLLNTTLFCAQPEQTVLQENKEITTTEEITVYLKKHGKKIIATLATLAAFCGSYLVYKAYFASKKAQEPETGLINTNKQNETKTNEPKNDYVPTRTTQSNSTTTNKIKQPPYSHALTEKTKLEFVQADITTLAFTPGKKAAIVNAANDGLLAGGGVCGAIFEASGPQHQVIDKKGRKIMRWKLQDQCDAIAHKNGKACPEGEARYTDGGEYFEAKNIAVIHAVGPSGTTSGREKLLTGAYYNSLVEAERHEICEIAFPAISTSIFGYKKEDANPVALAAVAKYFKEHPESKIEKVFFISYDPKDEGEEDFNQLKKDSTAFFTSK